MRKPLDVLLLADRDGKSLWPLTETLPSCLLPVGGKPLIVHALESLAASATANVTVVIATEDDQTPAFLTSIGFPTLNIQISNLPRPFVDADMLVMRGDILVSPQAIENMIMQFEDESGMAGSTPLVGVWRLAPGAPVPTWRQTATLSGNDDCTLPDLSAYWRMAIAMGNSDFVEIHPAGWLAGDGMRVGMNARVLTRRAPGPGVSIGAEAFIDKNVVLGESAIVGDRAYVSRGVKIVKSVVMPDTFVGAGVTLENAIACGHWLCRLDTGAIQRISDQTILARLAA